MKQRMGQHFGGKGHLPGECYKSVARIDYMSLKSKSDAIVYESFLINKYKPRYNKQSKKNDTLTINIDVEESWRLYCRCKPVKRVGNKQGTGVKRIIANVGIIIGMIAMFIWMLLDIL